MLQNHSSYDRNQKPLFVALMGIVGWVMMEKAGSLKGFWNVIGCAEKTGGQGGSNAPGAGVPVFFRVEF
jgi:hypothetical protein